MPVLFIDKSAFLLIYGFGMITSVKLKNESISVGWNHFKSHEGKKEQNESEDYIYIYIYIYTYKRQREPQIEIETEKYLLD